ncbi:MAG: protein phosphatase 2C domain-containing protein [Selenomonas sp.]|nr:protein phosphatase 2C domain-containing protein [Selenomonas sp.]
MWRIVQCDMQGRGHKKLGIPCQDKTFFCQRNGIQVIALADGAGSAKFSEDGAKIAVECVCDKLAMHFEEYLVADDGVSVKRELLQAVRAGLQAKAVDLACETVDLASTLLAVAVSEDHYILMHIGDGVIGYLKESELKVASAPENGEFINTTVFTTSACALQSMKLMKGKLGAIAGFVLMSDGTETSFYHRRDKRLAEVLKRIMHRSVLLPTKEIEKELRRSFKDVITQVTTDDCSLILLARRSPFFCGYQELTKEERYSLLNLPQAWTKREIQRGKKKLQRYDELLVYLQECHTRAAIKGNLHIPKRSLIKYLRYLSERHFVKRQGAGYVTKLML